VPPRSPRPPTYREPAARAYDDPRAPEYPPPAYGEPPPGDDRSWWERAWLSAALAALAALIVGFIVGLLVGESSSLKTATTEAGGAARTVTVKGPAHTTTVTHVVVHTHTVTTAAPGAGSEGEGGGHSYKGSGNGSIGTITVARQSMLRWTSGGGFSIKNSSEDERSLAFSSGASKGEIPVEPGTYHEVTVSATGEWSFTISPG
jgi:hypothetical protein